MKELELRLSLVCFGGASLAIYMNGISTELLHLARASAHMDRPRMVNPGRAVDGTSVLYKELLSALAPKRKLSVIVDVVAGSSAGGINGIMLSRALAHDLPLTPMRDLWLNLGDIEELMRDYSLASPWSKAYLYPLIWLSMRNNAGFREQDAEARKKLVKFFRSRWFRPPFSGKRMLDWMITAAESMGRVHPSFSLMPPAHGLDLYVTLTNFYGTTRSVTLHDPELVRERMHEKSLHFRYRRPISGAVISDLDDDNLPGLGFAARGTSSFPGAFTPVTFDALDQELMRRGMAWPKREEFLHRNFAEHLTNAEDREILQKVAFLDGGITNNKPFAEAMKATFDRPAHRQVDRRILFIDPSPDPVEERVSERRPLPSFFRMFLGAMVEIPRNNPIFGDLRRISEANEEFARIMRTVRAIERDVAPMIDDIVRLEPAQIPSQQILADWRQRSQDLSLSRIGYGSTGYLHQRVSQTLDRLAHLLRDVFIEAGQRYRRVAMARSMRRWAKAQGLLEEARDSQDSAHILQAQLDFLSAFDVEFRLRRVRHLLRHINAVMAGPDSENDTLMQQLRPEKFKRRLYVAIERGQKLFHPAHLIGLLDQAWREKLDERLRLEGKRDAPSLTLFENAMEKLGDVLHLKDLDEELDGFISGSLGHLSRGCERAVYLRDGIFRTYIGFDFIDTATLSMVSHVSIKEFQEVKVDRISPEDCRALTPHLEGWPLLGTSLFLFGAFFSRRSRENDYLWGRLHAAWRMLYIIMDAAGGEAMLPDGFNLKAFERRLLRQVLLDERPSLPHVHDVIDDMLARLRD